VEKWRLEHPHDTPPYPFMPSPTFAHAHSSALPAYAATIHKSQGSEYPAVVIPVMTQHYAMLQRNLLYTGVTRGKKLVVLVGLASTGLSSQNSGGEGRL
jgi:hypothetical protein